MNDGNLLLLAVLRTKAREDSATGALCDYVLDHLPEVGMTLRLDANLRIRRAMLSIWWVPAVIRNGHPEGPLVLKVVALHDRGPNHPHGSRMQTIVYDPNRREFVNMFAHVLRVFRS